MENFKLVRDQLCLLARSSPDDNYLMVTGLKKLDHVVKMTGDGTNDALLSKKPISDSLWVLQELKLLKRLQEPSLSITCDQSSLLAMKWGRSIFDSIRKFLQFQLSVNFVCLVMTFVRGAVLR